MYNICWTVLLSEPYAKTGAYNLIFGVDPGYLSQYLAYTFHNGQAFQKDVNVTVAVTMQQAVVNSVMYGAPNGVDGGQGPQLFPQ